MLKGIALTLMLFTSTVVFSASSCSHALPTNSTAFCASFKEAALCRCDESMKKPKGFCASHIDMSALFRMMLSTFGSIEKACMLQHDTSFQECVDDWKCYMSGGFNSSGEACSGSTQSCV